MQFHARGNENEKYEVATHMINKCRPDSRTAKTTIISNLLHSLKSCVFNPVFLSSGPGTPCSNSIGTWIGTWWAAHLLVCCCRGTSDLHRAGGPQHSVWLALKWMASLWAQTHNFRRAIWRGTNQMASLYKKSSGFQELSSYKMLSRQNYCWVLGLFGFLFMVSYKVICCCSLGFSAKVYINPCI